MTKTINRAAVAAAALLAALALSVAALAAAPAPAYADGGKTMYRLYNSYTGEHFYTESASEKDNLVNVGWNYEGVGWTAPSSSKTPVYRLYNPYAPGGDHHYTTDASEKDSLVKVGWSYEGVGWYSDDSKGVPLYRQYNPYAASGSHNYTASKDENDSLVEVGWRAEGIGWYGVKQESKPSQPEGNLTTSDYYRKVVSGIKTNPDGKEKNGNLYVHLEDTMDDGTPIWWRVSYDSEGDKLTFMQMFGSGESTIGFICGAPESGKDLALMQFVSSSSEISCNAYFYPKQVTRATALSWNYSGPYSLKKDAEDLANSCLRLTFMGVNNLLKDRYGISLHDMGFHSDWS